MYTYIHTYIHTYMNTYICMTTWAADMDIIDLKIRGTGACDSSCPCVLGGAEGERERERERESTTEPPVFEMALHMITASGVKAVSLHPMVWILAPDLFARTPAAVRAPVQK